MYWSTKIFYLYISVSTKNYNNSLSTTHPPSSAVAKASTNKVKQQKPRGVVCQHISGFVQAWPQAPVAFKKSNARGVKRICLYKGTVLASSFVNKWVIAAATEGVGAVLWD